MIRELLPKVDAELHCYATHNLVTQHSLQGYSELQSSARTRLSATKFATDSLG